MKNHTETPWFQSGSKVLTKGKEVARCNCVGVSTFQEQKANAALIVRACNLHDEFVEAAEVTVDWLVLQHGEPPADPSQINEYHRLILRLRNDLALAKAGLDGSAR